MNKIKKHAFHNFKTVQSFEKFLQGQYHNHWKNNFKTYRKSLDCIAVDGILFTMEEYDGSGHTLTWGNKRLGQNLEVSTQDRYKDGYKEAKAEIYPSFGTRDGINYLD